MALLSLDERDRMVEYDAVDLLPDLEEDVFFEDVLFVEIDEDYTTGLDEWWGAFVADMYL